MDRELEPYDEEAAHEDQQQDHPNRRKKDHLHRTAGAHSHVRTVEGQPTCEGNRLISLMKSAFNLFCKGLFAVSCLLLPTPIPRCHHHVVQ